MTGLARRLHSARRVGAARQAGVEGAAQGSATSVYAAVGAEFEGRGGPCLADCVVQGPFRGRDAMAMDGEGFGGVGV